MAANPRAGQLAQPEDLIDVAQVVTAYYTVDPDPDNVDQQVAFGTSGHRGSSLDAAFNEAHILATTQAIVEYRHAQGTTGPLFIGRDTHALSEPAWVSALEVLAANDVVAMIDSADRLHPDAGGQPRHPDLQPGSRLRPGRRDRGHAVAQSAPRRRLQVQPAQRRARRHRCHRCDRRSGPTRSCATASKEVKRVPLAQALQTAQRHDYLNAYIEDLPNVVDLHAISAEGIRIGADPLGGASVDYWGAIAERHNLDLTVVNPLVDATWRFMTLDTDGKIRMDCSSPNAMASLIANRESYQIGTGNDADSDRHGVVTPDGGLLNPNHYLAVAIEYLYTNRPDWPASTAVGKTAVSSSIIDRVVAGLGRKLVEVPVGFKWFVDGLLSGTIGFGGEESAGASFLRRDGSVWTTDKDGIILALLASEILAETGSTPSQRYDELAEKYGAPTYARIDAPAGREQKARLAKLSAEQVTATELAGEAITAKLTTAPGNGAPLGGLKVTTENAWFAARPSGTEDVYKIYAESFRGPEHLAEVQEAAREVVNKVIA